MINNFKKFEEYTKEDNGCINYNEYIADIIDNKSNSSKLSEPNNVSCITEGDIKESEDRSPHQVKKENYIDDKKPWTRQEYEKFAHPDVQVSINYETYLEMWNGKKDITYHKGLFQKAKEAASSKYQKTSSESTLDCPECSTKGSNIWSRLKIETKIMVIIGIIGLILSFLSLILKP